MLSQNVKTLFTAVIFVCLLSSSNTFPDDFSRIVQVRPDYHISSTTKGLPRIGPTFVRNHFLPRRRSFPTKVTAFQRAQYQPPYMISSYTYPSSSGNQASFTAYHDYSQSRSLTQPAPVQVTTFSQALTPHPVTRAPVQVLSQETNFENSEMEDDFEDSRDNSNEFSHSSVFFKVGDAETSYNIDHTRNKDEIEDFDFGFAKSAAGEQSEEEQPIEPPDIEQFTEQPEEESTSTTVPIAKAISHSSIEERQERSRPVQYSYKYRVESPFLDDPDFGHAEKRDGGRTRGRYYVRLPDGRTQVVDYYADETGYHPSITYI
ncbi:hypothetical protein SK128_005741 [Halocaridina rubra]|uniref:Pro-resilin n=1 Tax=Halocaridina rubra TaxID=373956 RepID=A0AAN8X6A4_HALRR